MKDDDAEKISRVVEWARAEGRLQEAEAVAVPALSDSEIDTLIAERNASRKSRDFARSDAIRAQLADAGIIVEDSKDGVRWKRK